MCNFRTTCCNHNYNNCMSYDCSCASRLISAKGKVSCMIMSLNGWVGGGGEGWNWHTCQHVKFYWFITYNFVQIIISWTYIGYSNCPILQPSVTYLENCWHTLIFMAVLQQLISVLNFVIKIPEFFALYIYYRYMNYNMWHRVSTLFVISCNHIYHIGGRKWIDK